jgi:DNA polymerase I-like protein with 3'-5' exonuclease and polymerase domains
MASALQLPLFRPPQRWTAPTEPPDLTGVRRLAVDTETRDERLAELGPGTYRDPNCYVVGLCLGADDSRRWYLPTRHEGGGNCAWDVQGWARAALNAYRGTVVGTHLLYDLEKLTMPEWGVTFPLVKRFDDVLTAEPLIDEWKLSYSLDATAQTHLGERKAEGHLRGVAALHGWRTNADVKRNLWRLHAADAGEYGEGDADLPLRILPKQLALLEAEDQLGVYDLERRLIPVLLAMRQRGVRVDIRKAEVARQQLVAIRDRWVAEVKRLAGAKAELMSADSLGPALEERGLRVPRTPKNQKPSLTRAFFEQHRGDALIDAIARGRRVNTLITTFFDGHIFGHLIPDTSGYGRIHCEFNALKRESDEGSTQGTIARLSSANPNMQNVPSREGNFDEDLELSEPIMELVRGCFVPEEGEDWQRDDESQVEYRFLVNAAVGGGGAEARRAYNEDPTTDFHKQTAAMMAVDPEDAVKRKRVKITNFSYVNGAGIGKLAETMGCGEDEARRFMTEYDGRLGFVRETYRAAARVAEQKGFITTAGGRRQRFPFWEPINNRGVARLPPLPREQALQEYGPRVKRAWTYKAINRYISGSAADLMKKAMVDGYEAGVCDIIGPYLLTVHDELDTSVPRTAQADAAVRELVHIMETCLPVRVPFKVDSTRGADWGACS